jgi:hypothetical protein
MLSNADEIGCSALSLQEFKELRKNLEGYKDELAAPASPVQRWSSSTTRNRPRGRRVAKGDAALSRPWSRCDPHFGKVSGSRSCDER